MAEAEQKKGRPGGGGGGSGGNTSKIPPFGVSINPADASQFTEREAVALAVADASPDPPSSREAAEILHDAGVRSSTHRAIVDAIRAGEMRSIRDIYEAVKDAAGFRDTDFAELTTIGTGLQDSWRAASYAARYREAAEYRHRRDILRLAEEEFERSRDLTTTREILAELEAEPGRHAIEIVPADSERTAEIPERTWFIDGMITTGTTLVTARKGIGKSFFVLQAAYAVASGTTFLGRTTMQARVLYVTTELDRIAIHERLQRFGPAPAGLFVHYGWRDGDAGTRDAEEVIQRHGIGVLIVDMFTAVLPAESDTNSYDLTRFLLRWRQMAQRNSAAVVMVWHSGKAERNDPMLSAIGTTGLTGQSDSVLAFERKRGAPKTTLHIMGNHGRENLLPVWFENLTWTLADGSEPDRECAPADEPILKFLRTHEPATAPEIAAITGRGSGATRAALSRLREQRLVDKDRHAWYAIADEQELQGVSNASS